MKKITLFLCMCLATSMSFAQLTVDSYGYSVSNSMSVDGVAGRQHGNLGVLTISATKLDEKYNSYLGYHPSLILTKSNTRCYPYANLGRNDTFNFYIDAAGYAYSRDVLLTSDSICKEEIESLPSSILGKITSLRGVTYYFKDDLPSAVSAFTTDGKAAKLNETELPLGATPEISRQIALEKQRKHIGLIAQEVERVFPEVVRTTYDGTKGILYSDLIGVLIEGIKELKQEIEDLKMQLTVNAPQAPANENINIQERAVNKMLEQNQAILYQNTPNPFNEETEISYRLGSNVISAAICIYNLNGRQLKKYPISSDTIVGKISVSASEFPAGMYIYSLVINNRVVDSKRMTLTD